jgi:hypothetical protein
MTARYTYYSDDAPELLLEAGYWDKARREDGTPLSPEAIAAAREAALRGEIDVRPFPKVQ